MNNLQQPNKESIEQILEQVLSNAIKLNASDVHFEPFATESRLRLRINGVLHIQQTFTNDIALRLCSRLKILANLDIAERRLPQDGRFTFELTPQQDTLPVYSVCDSNVLTVNNKITSHYMLYANANHENIVQNQVIYNKQHCKYDCRISTCPTMFGEKIVIRLLHNKQHEYNLELLGLHKKQTNIIQSYLQTSQGLILVTGPTGSGKTVTLYSMLNILNNAERNVLTIEDPIEIDLVGINQVEVNYKIGLDFATALRSFLRQDPDVIMIGEIRDLETAQMAIKASQTGHLVLATLHTNSASASILRLLNMNVASYNLAESLKLIIAQRLIRNLCPQCKIAYKYKINVKTLIDNCSRTEELKKYFVNSEKILVYKANHIGCSFCVNGYFGRSGIFEIMPITENLSKKILHNYQQIDLMQQAQQEGMKTLQFLAWEKVLQGITSIEEINRVVL